MLAQQAVPDTAYKFDIQRAQQVNRMGSLDAENLESAALVHEKPQTAPKQCVKQLQKLDNSVTLL